MLKDTDVVHLNVGGTVYAASAGTLRARPGYLRELTAVLPHKDPTKVPFIDRNGALFRYVLDFLRDGVLHPPVGFSEWGALRLEFAFFFGDSFDDFYYDSNAAPVSLPPSPQKGDGWMAGTPPRTSRGIVPKTPKTPRTPKAP
eukprot:Sspe_Gene.93138::Locus_65838_Transcript_1_1_Confidence_1.000_Length_496::g.93138::m.93138